jgi:EAL domain-containing protein (putative c-di-GMP-specific phosphodiesterase class I)
MKKVDIVVISISAPLKIGIYLNGTLFESIEENGKSSDLLATIFDKILKKYDVQSITYTNTPGSFMSIKLSYIFFKSLNILKDIELRSVDGFYFNDNRPIKAIGNRYFFKENDQIVIKPLKEKIDQIFDLPKSIKIDDFNTEVEPVYILPSV